ncbi:MAG: hypothetical protein HOK97_09875 [Deltaproteobacteria bacterium]|jgi:hypothetical protein|nr:hypothetical protein [Deltaproteobacteria bacterium]MBT6490059.1 hypothetical protein [Deltaproteobacteria bacterium]
MFLSWKTRSFLNKRTAAPNLIQVVIGLYDVCLSQVDSFPADAPSKVGNAVFDARAWE